MLAALCTALCALSAAARAEDDVLSRGADEPLATFARRVIPAQAELMAEPVELELPPLGRVAVVLFREEDGTNYAGWVLVPEQGQPRRFRRANLPPMSVADGLFSVEVESIFAATVGTGPGRDLCVLFGWYRLGSGNEAGYATDVYRWTGSAFERREDASRAVLGLTTAGKVRERLKRWRPAAARR